MTDSHQIWQVPPQQITLSPAEVHVWKAPLTAPEHEYTALQQVLSPDERERAARFYFEKHRRSWTIAHGVLRTLLARYLNTSTHKLHFVANKYGKPALAAPFAETGLQFNLSHSAELALYAFTYQRQIGVDVEYMRQNVECDLLAQSHFSAAEYRALQTLPASLQTKAFFLCWARKESYIKAKGIGLSLPLTQFDVSLIPDEPAKLLDSREEPQATTHWSLNALEPGNDYAGALTVEGFDWHLHCWQWIMG
ncbi:MAG: 4'-phosphopantetheinyl transferase superfamily protein [Ktedonobacteraceae bacterium]|nr:4'-phosphopantetheinyl transferase superfamily protein [Ktedonobacteraceae bacterium]